jgi:SAM-dependent methyltransferase
MSDFYSELAKYYADLFPTGKAQIQLLAETAGQPPRTILDVACGSGGYAVQLQAMGYAVTAIDLDTEMIRQLNEKDANIQAWQMNMLDIDSLPGSFDLIFCIGNSIVHLDSSAEIELFLRSCRCKLNGQGSLILQTVNYDRIIAKGIAELPTLTHDEKHLTLERHYRPSVNPGKVDFLTILSTPDSILENHVDLLPLQSHALLNLLKAAGFVHISFFGSFQKDAFKPHESFHLVAVASY